ncbi:MAG: glycosyltransferase family 2 protein [Methanomicrobiales archaeon]|nr:glycosyltransferase family 2 protein [Methanomicrobiales archaeon]
MHDTISIVIPLYNKEKYISRTISSVLSQSYSNFECIIVDSSSDRSTEIVKEFTDSRIRHLIQENRTYLPIARNIGVKVAKNNLIAFIDADDEWAPDHLESMVNLYSQFPNAGVFATSYVKLRHDGSEMIMIFAGIPKPPWEGCITRFFNNCAKGDVPVSSSSCAIRKDVFNEMGGFDENLIDGGEDHHLWGRIALKYPIAFTWKGPGIYHTEASGRMCNDVKSVIGDPLSQYLTEQLTNGLIPSDLQEDINAYIRRREKTVWFSKFFRNSHQDEIKNYHKKRCNQSMRITFLSQMMNKFNGIIVTLFNSGFYNFCRKVWCYLHGWHIPRLDRS